MTSVLIAFSDTGGGHRAAATAIRDVLAGLRPDVAVTLVDPFARCPRWPFRELGAGYPIVVERAPWLWHAGFVATNTTQRTRFVQRLAWPAMRPTFEAIAGEHRPDVIISTHPLLTAPLRAVYPQTPIVVVVTDLVSGHASWYSTDADITLVPTVAARDRAVAHGLARQSVAIAGVPVSPQFVAVPGEKPTLQAELGWSVDHPTVLLAGGADGVGPIEALCDAIDRAELPCDLAVVTGRNTALAERLRARSWRGRMHVYGFVTNFSELLRGASALITKAGPGTISEACASGCPMILHGAIPGQETGNVEFVTGGRAGVWAPSPLAVTAALHAWLIGRDAGAARKRASAAALRLAKPHAARDIAERVLALLDAGAPATDSSVAADAATTSHQSAA